MLSFEIWRVLLLVRHAMLLPLFFAVCYGLLNALTWNKRSRAFTGMKRMLSARSYPAFLLSILLIRSEEAWLEERRRLLNGCGLPLDAVQYELLKRLTALLSVAIGLAGVMAVRHSWTIPFVPPALLVLLSAAGGLLVMFNGTLLRALRDRRNQAIMKEVYQISKHLLFYAGSGMNLHGKLARCLPYTRVIRAEMHLLINEWYQHAELALDRFKQRLGTREAASFAETLKSIRSHEDDRYYVLLRQRIDDFKEQMELSRESRKETSSYILFVLAGIPILYTFRLFIYPWVAEGQKLFHSLN